MTDYRQKDYTWDESTGKQTVNTRGHRAGTATYTGNLKITDGQSIKDSGNDDRIVFTNDGTLSLRDESGNVGLELQTNRDITISTNMGIGGSGSFTTGLKVTALPTADPGVAGTFFVTGSTSMALGGITGSGFKILAVSQG